MSTLTQHTVTAHRHSTVTATTVGHTIADDCTDEHTDTAHCHSTPSQHTVTAQSLPLPLATPSQMIVPMKYIDEHENKRRVLSAE